MKRLILIIGLAVFIPLNVIETVQADVQEEFSWQQANIQSSGGDKAPDYRGYYYNYPHEVPPDYVYRTGRVFGPSPSRFDWRNPLAFFRGEGASLKTTSTTIAGKKGESVDQGLPQNQHGHPQQRPNIRRLKHALSLYQGNFLDQMILKGSPLFDEWAILQREMLTRQAIEAMCLLIDYH